MLVLAFVVLRPIMKNLFNPSAPVSRALQPVATELDGDTVTLSSRSQAPALPRYEDQIAVARTVVAQDPKRAAQVVKEWVATDG